MSNKLGIWIIGAMVAGLGLIGLFLSAYADDAVMHLTGLLIAAFSVVFIFSLVGDHADMPEAASEAVDPSAAGESADRAGHDEEIRPLAAEVGVGAAEIVDATVEPGEVVVGSLDKRSDALV